MGHLGRDTQANRLPKNTGTLRNDVSQGVVLTRNVVASCQLAIQPSHGLKRTATCPARDFWHLLDTPPVEITAVYKSQRDRL
jgi:hypothetical protein